MGGKSSAPPPPDYSGIANASEKSAELSYALGKEQLAWAKEQYGKDSALNQRVVDRLFASADRADRIADENNATARKDRARYEATYQPIEDDLARDAREYASGARRDLEMGRAAVTAGQQFDQGRAAALRQLESFGVDPTSTRYAALDIGQRAAKAAGQAAAANQASQVVDATGRALRSEAINVGRGYPGQVAGQYGTALTAGQQAGQQAGGALSGQLATTASGASTMGTGAQWQGLGNQALGTWGNALNTGYQNQLAAFNANQNASSGWGSALGLAGGLLTSPWQGTVAAALFEDGGAVPEPDEMTPDGMAGGHVPETASPSRGAVTDDIPARLNAGEFIVPREAVSWFGEKHFQKLIEKARDEKSQATAKPEIRPAIPMQPTVRSRQMASALPVG